MRRRQKPVIQDDGSEWDGTVPDWVLRFMPDLWPGDQPWEQWDNWWEAANRWAESRYPFGILSPDLRALMPELPSRPWNEADI